MSRRAYRFLMISQDTGSMRWKKNFLKEGYLILNLKQWHNCYFSFLNLIIKKRINCYNYYDNWKQYSKEKKCVVQNYIA